MILPTCAGDEHGQGDRLVAEAAEVALDGAAAPDARRPPRQDARRGTGSRALHNW